MGSHFVAGFFLFSRSKACDTNIAIIDNSVCSSKTLIALENIMLSIIEDKPTDIPPPSPQTGSLVRTDTEVFNVCSTSSETSKCFL